MVGTGLLIDQEDRLRDMGLMNCGGAGERASGTGQEEAGYPVPLTVPTEFLPRAVVLVTLTKVTRMTTADAPQVRPAIANIHHDRSIR